MLSRDRYIAEDAQGLIETDHSPLPPVIDQEEATKDDAPVVEAAGDNVVLRVNFFTANQKRQAFAEADKIVNVKIRYPRNSPYTTRGVRVSYCR